MAEKRLKIWFDREGDYLEVIFDQRAGFSRETANDQVMEKVDERGNVSGLLGTKGQRAATKSRSTLRFDLTRVTDKRGGELETGGKKNGYGFDCLTQSDARYLAPDADIIRDRMVAARQNRGD